MQSEINLSIRHSKGFIVFQMRCAERTGRRRVSMYKQFRESAYKICVKGIKQIHRAKEYCKDKSRYNRVLIIITILYSLPCHVLLSSCAAYEISFTSFLVDYPSTRRFKPATALRRSYFAKMYITRGVVIFLCPFQRYLLKQNFRLV